MIKWQDDFHLAVYAPVGIGRVGPRRQRLTASEHKARKKADAALARTLEAESEIRAKWRAEIRAQLEQSFADELARWKVDCQDLQARLRAADHKLIERADEIARLQRELAELRSELAESSLPKPPS